LPKTGAQLAAAAAFAAARPLDELDANVQSKAAGKKRKSRGDGDADGDDASLTRSIARKLDFGMVVES
jgi:hypothetical protein